VTTWWGWGLKALAGGLRRGRGKTRKKSPVVVGTGKDHIKETWRRLKKDDESRSFNSFYVRKINNGEGWGVTPKCVRRETQQSSRGGAKL